jgi:hypothetical protein
MNINMSQLAPYIWIVTAVIAAFVIFIVIRFFWRHILRYFFHGCVVVVGLVVLLAILHYLKLF